MLDPHNKYINSVKRKTIHCQDWTTQWAQTKQFSESEEVLPEMLDYLLVRILSCLDTVDKEERTKMIYYLKI
jgi:hypothetical protein